MDESNYCKKAEDKLLMYFYNKHVTESGETVSTIGFSEINTFNNEELAREIPEIEWIDSTSIVNFNARYFNELEHKEFISTKDAFKYILTEAGYFHADKIAHPVKSFIAEHWKWLVSALLSFITVMFAITRLIVCK